MKRRNRFQPYIRRANGRERTESLRISLRLAYYRSYSRGKPFYVLVQRGFPNLAIEVGATKLDIKRGILAAFTKQLTFKQWSRRVKKLAQDTTRPSHK